MARKLNSLALKTIIAFMKIEMDLALIEEKVTEFEAMNGLQVLQSFTLLDSKKLKAVCDEIGCDVEDMKATFRVLTAIEFFE